MDNISLFCFFSMMIFFMVVVPYLTYLHYEDKKASWKALAESNQLTFVPGNWLGDGAYVYGNYRDCPLKLETFQKRQGKSSYTYTRIVVSASHSANGNFSLNKAPIGRPVTVSEVTSLLTSTKLSGSLKGELKALSYGYKISYEQSGIEGDIQYLQFLFDLLCDLIDGYLKVLALSGEAVLALQEMATNSSHVLKPIATQLLHDIGRETTKRLGGQAEHLFCSRCLTCCEARKVRLPWWQSITYYGCRICGQSREFLNGRLIAVLDSQMETEMFKQNGVLRVNWLAQRKLFDFDEVEIVQATDEDVERFAVQVGNDTDPKRKPFYQEMRCVVSSECRLSENTRRILARMFGAVEVGELKRR
jgi:hypothetical protein